MYSVQVEGTHPTVPLTTTTIVTLNLLCPFLYCYNPESFLNTLTKGFSEPDGTRVNFKDRKKLKFRKDGGDNPRY